MKKTVLLLVIVLSLLLTSCAVNDIGDISPDAYAPETVSTASAESTEEKTAEVPTEATTASSEPESSTAVATTVATTTATKAAAVTTTAKASSTQATTTRKSVTTTAKVKPTTTVPTTAFDVNYWVTFGKNYALSLGMVISEEAKGSWDTPLSAGLTLKNTERELKARISRYQREGYDTIWVWTEKRADGNFHLYVGYG